MVHRPSLGMWDGSGASDGEVPVWDDATQKWVPGTVSGLSDPTTTKGDLIVRGASAIDRLGVGSNGQVLTADSTQTLGAKWATPAAGETTFRDPKCDVPPGHTRLDGFDDDSIGSDWIAIHNTGHSGYVSIAEHSDVLSFATGLTADAVAEMHAMVLPLSLYGGSMVDGDGFVSDVACYDYPNTNYVIGGMVLSDSATYGAGNQLVCGNTNHPLTVERRGLTGWNTGVTQANILGQTPVYKRLAKISGTTYRIDVSPDCVHWVKGATFTVSFTPTHVGFCASGWGTATKGVVTTGFLDRVAGVT